MVSREALRALSEAAFGDINHYLRPGHLKQLRAILDDPEASDNDKFVAFDFLKNANIAAGGVLPMCQDTGTAIIMGKKGARVITDGDDEAALSEGARDAYLRRNLRYSQVAPLSMYEEKNTANNMPAQCEIYAEGDDAYKFMFMAKGGGSRQQELPVPGDPSRAHNGSDRPQLRLLRHAAGKPMFSLGRPQRRKGPRLLPASPALPDQWYCVLHPCRDQEPDPAASRGWHLPTRGLARA